VKKDLVARLIQNEAAAWWTEVPCTSAVSRRPLRRNTALMRESTSLGLKAW